MAKKTNKEIIDKLMIDSETSLKLQIRHLKSRVSFLTKRRNIRNCDFKFVCDGKQKKGDVICKECFEHIRKETLKSKEAIKHD